MFSYICIVCNKEISLKNPRRTSNTSPCQICASKDPLRRNKIKSAFANKTKEELDARTEKRKATTLERYGVEFASQIEEIKQKAKDTCMTRYGTDNASKSAAIIQKIKDVSMERYGVPNPAQADVNRAKISEGLLNSDFDRVSFQKGRMQKMKDAGIELQGAVDKNKACQTNLERYGSEHFFASDAGRMTKDNLMENYGWNEEQYNSLVDSRRQTEETFIKRYGKIEGAHRYSEYKKSTVQSKENMVKRYGEELGTLKYETYIVGKRFQFGKASKESLRFLLPLYRKLRRLGISRDDMFIGVNGSNEYFISNKNGFFLYDFAIKSLNIIVEYNGAIWHPHTDIPIEEGMMFTTPYASIDYQEAVTREETKLKSASDAGFTVFVVWSYDNLKEHENTIIEHVQQCLNASPKNVI